MPQQATRYNPFMLMLNPELVLAAIAKSERLGLLNRRLCRPLDEAPGAAATAGDAEEALCDEPGLADAEQARP